MVLEAENHENRVLLAPSCYLDLIVRVGQALSLILIYASHYLELLHPYLCIHLLGGIRYIVVGEIETEIEESGETRPLHMFDFSTTFMMMGNGPRDKTRSSVKAEDDA